MRAFRRRSAAYPSQGLEPCGAIEHVGALRRSWLAERATGLLKAAGGRSRAAVEHTLDSLSLSSFSSSSLSSRSSFSRSSMLSLFSVSPSMSFTDFSFAGGDFCASLFDVHNLPPKMIVVVWVVSMSKLRVSSASGLFQSRKLFECPPRKSLSRTRRVIIGEYPPPTRRIAS